ncbi:YlbF family regulator [Levilactobacillus bambusae]|uniref:UPF0342 protein DCM90_02445 n=1 Tax=Levilactobacillus bambusae TaxID=2024736 RepID=A0A2V1N1G0_9LACO|nr:YlbF family regulator [Levilactobacillus bambusae]PWG01054.1 hypothetical protein DCM90_02445 [Levilactobacillus bambusae]
MAEVVNVYDTANQLEQELRETPEYQALAGAYGKMKADAVAYDVFKNFQDVQMQLQTKQMQGVEITEDEMQQARDLADKVSQFDVVKDLMAKEKAVNDVLAQLNQIITKPIQDLYHD